MNSVKEEVAWEAEYVEALWKTLYAGHHEAADMATAARTSVVNSVRQPKTETTDAAVVPTINSAKDACTTILPKTEQVQTTEDVTNLEKNSPTDDDYEDDIFLPISAIATSNHVVTNTVVTPVPTNVANNQDSSTNNSNLEVIRNPKKEPVWAQDYSTSLKDTRTPAAVTANVSIIQAVEDSSTFSTNLNTEKTGNPKGASNTHSSLKDPMKDPISKIVKTEPVWTSTDFPNSLEEGVATIMVRTQAAVHADISTQSTLENHINNNPNTEITRNSKGISNTHPTLEDNTSKKCKTEPVSAEDLSDSHQDATNITAPTSDVSTTQTNLEESSTHNMEIAQDAAKVSPRVADPSNEMCKNLGKISPNMSDNSTTNMPVKEAVSDTDVSVNNISRTACNPGSIASSLQESNSRNTSKDDPDISETCLQTPNEPAVPKIEPVSLTPCYVRLEHVAFKKAFVCQICQRFFRNKQQLMTHIVTHTQDEINTIKIEKKVERKGKFECHICSNRFKWQNNLRNHIKIHKRDPFREQVNRKTPKDRITKIYYTCDNCGMSTVRKESLIRHMKIHKKEVVACDICEKQFHAAWAYVEHIKLKTCKPLADSTNNLQNLMLKSCFVKLERLNTGYGIAKLKVTDEIGSFDSESEVLLGVDQAFDSDEIFYCGVCEEQFETLSSMADHACRRPKRPISCDVCKKRFRFQTDLVAHTRLHTGERPFTCDVCNKQFRLKRSVKMHIRTVHLGEDPFPCKFCEKKFRSTQALNKHVRKHAGEKEKKLYSCKVCKKRFRYQRECDEHGRVHTGEKPFRCAVCNMRFRVEVALRIHRRLHTGEKPFSCAVCKRAFRVWQTLDAHKRVHTGEKPFTCDVCNKQFRRYDTLKTHQRIHTGQKPFACEFCPKRFTQSGHLKSHHRSHTGEKAFKCTVCNKRFRSASHLKNHARIHSSERPYPCNFCQKAFRTSNDLRIHKRIHTGEKPYQCKVCKKQCTQASNLRTHMRTHEKKTWPFSCNVCEKRFQRRPYLDNHMKLRHDARTPFMCDVCGAKFSSDSVLSVHARSHYGGE